MTRLREFAGLWPIPVVLAALLAVVVVLAVTGCHAPHPCPRPAPGVTVTARCWR